MSNIMQFRRSDTASAVPLISQLQTGEPAWNTTDKNFYIATDTEVVHINNADNIVTTANNQFLSQADRDNWDGKLDRSGDTMTGVLDMNGNVITGVGTPTADSHAVNKAYADSLASGLDPKESVRLATTATDGNIANYTNNGGVGDTLAPGGAALTIDGVAVADGDRILVKDQTDALQNGVYTVSGVGTSILLTRATDFDGTPANEVSGGNFFFVEEGTDYHDTGWVVSSDGQRVLNTDTVDFTQFSSAGVVQGGAGLLKTGITLDIQDDGNGTMTISADAIGVANGGITETQLNASVAGGGLTGGAGTALAVNHDGSLAITTDQVGVAAGGVTETHLNSSVAGDGLSGGSGTALSVNTDASLTITADNVGISNTGVTEDHLNTSIAGNGITGGAGTALSVDLDGPTLSVSAAGLKLADLTDGNILVGNGSNVASGVPMSGDATIDNTGAVTVSNSAITTAKINDDAVTAAKLNADTAGAGLVQNGTSGALDVGQGTGIVVNADDVALDTTYTDGLYVNVAGDTMEGSLDFASTYEVQNATLTNCVVDGGSY